MSVQGSDAAGSRYSVHPADLVGDRERVIALWRENPLQPARAEAKYQWYYLDNPYAQAQQLLLCEGQQADCVGAAGLVTRQLVARDIALSAGLLSDFFVLPGHRTALPALMLQRQMRSLGMGLHDLLYGYPNDKSLPIVRRIGYVQIGEVAKCVALLRYGTYLERWLPRWLSRAAGALIERVMPWYFRPYAALQKRWQGEWLAAADARFDALWERARRCDSVIGVRDRQFLSWRFFARPSHQYRLFALSRERGGEIAAYAVCEALGDTLHIRDLLCEPAPTDSNQPLRVLVHRLSRQAYREGFVRLSFEFLGSDAQRATLRSAGLFERDTTPLVASLSSGASATVEGLSWYITAADTEL